MQNFINGSLIVKKFPLSQYSYKKNKIILANLHLLKYISINSATRRSTCMYNVFHQSLQENPYAPQMMVGC